MIEGFNHIISNQEYEFPERVEFLEPVDLKKEFNYCTVVPFPTSISTIAEKLRNKFYRY